MKGGLRNSALPRAVLKNLQLIVVRESDQHKAVDVEYT